MGSPFDREDGSLVMRIAETKAMIDILSAAVKTNSPPATSINQEYWMGITTQKDSCFATYEESKDVFASKTEDMCARCKEIAGGPCPWINLWENWGTPYETMTKSLEGLKAVLEHLENEGKVDALEEADTILARPEVALFVKNTQHHLLGIDEE